jgi:hypothetical protein
MAECEGRLILFYPFKIQSRTLEQAMGYLGFASCVLRTPGQQVARATRKRIPSPGGRRLPLECK